MAYPAGRSRRVAGLAVLTCLVVTIAACGSSTHRGGPVPERSVPTTSAAADPTPSTATSTTPTPQVSGPASSYSIAGESAPNVSASRSSVPAVPAGTGPVIVIDPGHAPTITHTDPSGLVDSDYENEPEMADVFDVALLVRSQLVAAGYRVVMTKNAVTDRVALGQRAAIANNAGAALAVSIHDQAGSSGGISFNSGNNIVYYQAVGDYRATPAGVHVVFTDSAVAATSQHYGQIFQSQRAAAQGNSVNLQGNTGYDLGSRGLAPGNIWIVQLLSKVPWIYNEAGGNSAGMSGLNSTDKQKYANGLVAAIKLCVPVR